MPPPGFTSASSPASSARVKDRYPAASDIEYFGVVGLRSPLIWLMVPARVEIRGECGVLLGLVMALLNHSYTEHCGAA